MPKFYIKTVVASMLLSLFILILLDMVKGLELGNTGKGMVTVLVVMDMTFIVLNEKATVREIWHWWMVVILLTVGALSYLLVF